MHDETLVLGVVCATITTCGGLEESCYSDYAEPGGKTVAKRSHF